MHHYGYPVVHGIVQARILEWVAFPFSRGSSQPRARTQVACIAGKFFTSRATRILEWVAYPFSSGSSQRRNQTRVSRTAGSSLATELPGKPMPPPHHIRETVLQVANVLGEFSPGGVAGCYFPGEGCYRHWRCLVGVHSSQVFAYGCDVFSFFTV